MMTETIKDPWLWCTVVMAVINIVQSTWFKDYRRIIGDYKRLLDETMVECSQLVSKNRELLETTSADPAALEAAFWHFDKLHKEGEVHHGTRLTFSERDAFKRAVRPLLRRFLNRAVEAERNFAALRDAVIALKKHDDGHSTLYSLATCSDAELAPDALEIKRLWQAIDAALVTK